MKTLKRKTRSDKFPLTFHPTGQYCKKIKGKMYYFVSYKKQALERYLDQSTYLHGCQENLQKPTDDNMTLKQLCDMYLKYQYSKLQANDLTASHHNEQIMSLNRLMAFLGQNIEVNNISTLDLQNYKRSIQRGHLSVYRLNLHISIMKALFHWARKNDVLVNIPNIDAISRGKIVHQERFTFNSEQINKLLSCEMYNVEHSQQNNIASFIWGIADDVLRDVYVRGKYRDAILPMTVNNCCKSRVKIGVFFHSIHNGPDIFEWDTRVEAVYHHEAAMSAAKFGYFFAY
jgi:hypothetical protein